MERGLAKAASFSRGKSDLGLTHWPLSPRKPVRWDVSCATEAIPLTTNTPPERGTAPGLGGTEVTLNSSGEVTALGVLLMWQCP